MPPGFRRCDRPTLLSGSGCDILPCFVVSPWPAFTPWELDVFSRPGGAESLGVGQYIGSEGGRLKNGFRPGSRPSLAVEAPLLSSHKSFRLLLDSGATDLLDTARRIVTQLCSRQHGESLAVSGTRETWWALYRLLVSYFIF